MEYEVWLSGEGFEEYMGSSPLRAARRHARKLVRQLYAEGRWSDDMTVSVDWPGGESRHVYAIRNGRVVEQRYMPARAGGELIREWEDYID